MISNSSLRSNKRSSQEGSEEVYLQLEQYRVNQDDLLRELSEKTSRLEHMSEAQRQFLKPFKSKRVVI